MLHSGELKLPSTPAGTQSKTKLSKDLLETTSSGAETWLSISFRNREETSWAEAKHEVAWCQHRLTHSPKTSIPTSLGKSLETTASKTHYQVSGANFTFLFDRVRGSLLQWSSNSKTVFQPLDSVPPCPAIRLSFWRPPTDNDMRTVDGYFRNNGLDMLTSQLRSFSIDHESKGQVRLSVHLRIAPPVQSWGFDAELTYLVLPNGSLHIHAKATPTGPGPDQIPRVGFDVRLDCNLNAATWFGLGPGESYPDKQLAQRVGIYSSPLTALHTPYEMPQENGNHMEARWLKMVDAAGDGFKASRVDAPFQWAASMYSPQNIDSAKHPPDLVADDTTVYLRLDAEGSGVGSGACGPWTRDEYKVKMGTKEFEFVLEPVSG
jgi:beta-galactosidase